MKIANRPVTFGPFQGPRNALQTIPAKWSDTLPRLFRCRLSACSGKSRDLAHRSDGAGGELNGQGAGESETHRTAIYERAPLLVVAWSDEIKKLQNHERNTLWTRTSM